MWRLSEKLCIHLGVVGFLGVWGLGTLARVDLLRLALRAMAASAVMGLLGFFIGRAILGAITDELVQSMADEVAKQCAEDPRAEDHDASDSKETAA